MESKYHECETINKSENVSIEKIKGSWTWIFWNDKKGNIQRQNIPERVGRGIWRDASQRQRVS